MDEEKEHRYYVRVMSPKILIMAGWNGWPDYKTWWHAHWCPACNNWHEMAVWQPFSNGAKWKFNWNYEKPTFEPSMNRQIGPNSQGRTYVCHYYVTDGQIKYQGDCTPRSERSDSGVARLA